MDKNMISELLLSVLRCPSCHSEKILLCQKGYLICPDCQLAYPVIEGVPHMLVESAIPSSGIDAESCDSGEIN